MNILVTGGCGFIGSHLVKHLCDTRPTDKIINIDAMTYAARPAMYVDRPPNLVEQMVDIRDQAAVARIMDHYSPVIVYHLAAESHVCRSIAGPRDFITTNVVGTFNLLQEFTRLRPRGMGKFVHVSTDEVFGEIESGQFDEQSPLAPRSPYSASKASAECLVKAWHHTYGLNTTVINMCNVFGPNQHEEKLIPMTIKKIMSRGSVIVHGKGDHSREWLWVGDAIDGIANAFTAKPGSRFGLGSGDERTNMQIINAIHELIPDKKLHLQFSDARPNDDKRYAISAKKASKEMGWAPTLTFEVRLKQTIDWYCDSIISGRDAHHGRGAQAHATLPT